MVKLKTRRNKRDTSPGNVFLSSQLLTAIIYAVAFVATAFSVMISGVSFSDYSFISIGAFGLASFVSAFLAGMKTRKKGMITGLLYTLPENLLILALSLIFNGFTADLNLLYLVLTLTLTATVGGILAVNKRFKKKRG